MEGENYFQLFWCILGGMLQLLKFHQNACFTKLVKHYQFTTCNFVFRVVGLEQSPLLNLLEQSMLSKFHSVVQPFSACVTFDRLNVIILFQAKAGFILDPIKMCAESWTQTQNQSGSKLNLIHQKASTTFMPKNIKSL